MKVPFERRAVEAIASIPDPRESEQWFRNLPPDRREQMIREHQERLLRGLQDEIDQRHRTIAEAASMGGIFLIADIFCPGGGVLCALLSLALGAGVGYFCNRLEAHLLLTALLGMFVFLGSQYVLLGGLGWMHLGACFPLGAACALLGFQREQRSTL
jgi:hypothetical protein